MNQNFIDYEEKEPKYINGLPVIIFAVIGVFVSIFLSVMSVAINILFLKGLLIATVFIYLAFIMPLLFIGIKVIKPNEALVLTLFGKYYGTIKKEGMYFVNPFATAAKPVIDNLSVPTSQQISNEEQIQGQGNPNIGRSSRISLKTLTLDNERQKINDEMGNPIIIGIVVIWRVINPTKAVFNVDNYTRYLSIQADSALRDVVRLHPYHSEKSENEEKTLRGSSVEIAEKIKNEIQKKVDIAGLEIMEARITHLSYAPEIAAAMLQRQQASAVVDARQLIVEGAVGMVEMALEKLSEKEVVELDEERKAAMVSNLLVVLCGNKDAQPIVNSGSIY